MKTTGTVSVREEPCVIPTYKIHAPEKAPLFLERRAYQGSTGKVYPMPVTEKIYDEKENIAYNAVILENEYLLVMILPQFGGRIQRAYDKTNGYDFVYYNHVIKPALVGLTGPWISGGIEFNWPQHHRPTTFDPVDYSFQENGDGSYSVFVGETDRMYGTKGMARITLYPGKAYIEISGRLYNSTDFPQTFLWWANPAVPANDHTYSVFPPDVTAVMDHGKRAVSNFPIATGEYYKYDYSEGIDISRYANIKVPTSYMAAHSNYDFIGNYDESLGAGLLHVADHHISPGKKQWTWGSGNFGQAWDRNLTDEDGPYVELMTGVFADNQPDFTWLKPHEEKTFEQYFMPYKGVGYVSNATKEAAIGFTVKDGAVDLKIYVTAVYENACICVTGSGTILYEKNVDLSPQAAFTDSFNTNSQDNSYLVSVVCGGETLVEYSTYKKTLQPAPEPAEALKAPSELKSTEELYLAAQHLEQYRHATFEPKEYYEEGLRRDPSDIRLNNGYGLLLLRRGNIEESVNYFKAAINKQTWKNPNPYSGECFFNLGIALEKLGRTEEAFDAFYKATWSAETQNGGFYWLACLLTRKGEYKPALAFVEQAMVRNWHCMRSRMLKAALMRKLNLNRDDFIRESLAIDPLYMGLQYEKTKESAECSGDIPTWFFKAMRSPAHNYLTLSLEYIRCGLYDDAFVILSVCEDKNPLLSYYKGYVKEKSGDTSAAREWYSLAEQGSPDDCFPNRLEEMLMLSCCIALLRNAPMAEYYLGNLLYDKKQHEKAITCWENALRCKPNFALCRRNLSIAYFNKRKDSAKALEEINAACALDPRYARYLLEADQLSSIIGEPVSKRLETLKRQIDLVKQRDDLYLRYIALLNCAGFYDEALECLASRVFHPWEGGEGKASGQYRFALIQLAKQSLKNNNYAHAVELLEKTLSYPWNFGEGKLPNTPDNQAYYLMGTAYRQMDRFEEAVQCFKEAASGDQEPSTALYYNEQPSDYIFYQGLAHRALGDEISAKKVFHKLVVYGEKHLFDDISFDYFAVSMPEMDVYQDDPKQKNTVYCNYLRALGLRGLGQNYESAALFKDILALKDDHSGAIEHLRDFTEKDLL
jgi:tetratricopeptide (TPR) repeat protein